MSWTDPCSNCGEHRADCTCGDWNGYKKKAEEEKEKVTCSLWDRVGGICVIPSLTWEEVKEKYDNGEVSIVLIPKKKLKKTIENE